MNILLMALIANVFAAFINQQLKNDTLAYMNMAVCALIVVYMFHLSEDDDVDGETNVDKSDGDGPSDNV